ncbi:MAG: hypothetical protein IID18_06740 [Nitrospinae bacterium]|nr:hypothetical protein [Nitrospinota bacterium]
MSELISRHPVARIELHGDQVARLGRLVVNNVIDRTSKLIGEGVEKMQVGVLRIELDRTVEEPVGFFKVSLFKSFDTTEYELVVEPLRRDVRYHLRKSRVLQRRHVTLMTGTGGKQEKSQQNHEDW